jgi:ubiquitin-conjugating enzyme E2 D/E
MAQKRLAKELKDMQKEAPANCSAGLVGENLFEWLATIIGPKDTPYEGGMFQLKLFFPSDYPYLTHTHTPNTSPSRGLRMILTRAVHRF